MSPADIQSAIRRIRENAGLLAAPVSDDVKRILENAGLAPQVKSAELLRIIANTSPKCLTEAERAAILPRDPTVLRILGNSCPSLLTPAERWAQLPEGTRRVLGNLQAASGFKYVPDNANAASQKG